MNEREHLAQADRQIAECKAHIARHREIIRKAAQRGQETSWAREMLRAFEETLRIFEKHRQLIVDRLQGTEQR